MQKKMIRGVVALLLLVSGIHGAAAGQAQTTFQVSATVLTNCAVSAGNLQFGSYNPGAGTPTNMGTSVSVTCTNGLGYTVLLDGGGSHSATARVMSDGNSHNLNYQLYTSGAYSTVFGDGTTGTSTVAGTGNGSLQAIPVFGQIPAAQYVPAGGYTDTIQVTVNY